MVVSLVLELKKPFLGLSVHIDIDIYAACVVFLALFQIVEHSVRTKPACAYRGEIHKTERFLPASEIRTHLVPQSETFTDLGSYKRVLHLYVCQT